MFCLHATAYSAQTFRLLLPALEGERLVIAPDTPGYGGSDSPPAPIDLGGYAEAAVRRPDLFRRLVLIGVPYFHGLDRDVWQSRLTQRHELGASLAQFAERWGYPGADRPTGLTLERGFENFVDEPRASPHGSWAHEALFSYDDRARLKLVSPPTLVINPAGHLAEGSRAGGRADPGRQDRRSARICTPILETAPRCLKDEISRFLYEDDRT